MNEQRPPHYRRNFWCLALDFCFFGIGMSFFNVNTVIPSYLTMLGASSAIIGLQNTMQRAGWLLPQLVSARFLSNKSRKKTVVLWAAGLTRLLILLLAILVWIGGVHAPGWLIPVFTLTTLVFWLGDGFGSVAWFDLLSNSIPAERRGRLTGTGQALSGSFGFLAGFLVEWLLGEAGFPYPDNYALIFLLGFLMLAISWMAISLIKEHKQEAVASEIPAWREFLPRLGQLLRKDTNFRRYLIARQFLGLIGMVSPFFMVYAIQELGMPPQVAGRYTSMSVVGSVVGALLFGWANERRGTREAMQISAGLHVLLPLLPIAIPRLGLSPIVLAWVYGLVFFAYNLTVSSYLPAWIGYLLELAPEAERAMYVGLNNTINGIAALFSVAGGIFLQVSGDNYELLFLMTAIGVAFTWPLVQGLKEPRHT